MEEKEEANGEAVVVDAVGGGLGLDWLLVREAEPQVAEPTVVAIGVSTRRRAPG